MSFQENFKKLHAINLQQVQHKHILHKKAYKWITLQNLLLKQEFQNIECLCHPHGWPILKTKTVETKMSTFKCQRIVLIIAGKHKDDNDLVNFINILKEQVENMNVLNLHILKLSSKFGCELIFSSAAKTPILLSWISNILRPIMLCVHKYTWV